MGQHRRDIQRIYQRPEKNSQSAFRQNPHDALQTQGSGLAMSKLWDGSDLLTYLGSESHAFGNCREYIIMILYA